MTYSSLVKLIVPVIGILIAAVSLPSFAGRIYAADSNFDTIEQSNYATDGQYWHGGDTITGGFSNTNGLGFGFNVDFGHGVVNNPVFDMDAARGRVRFLDSLGNPTGDFFDPMHLTGANYNPANLGFYTYGFVAPEFLLDAPLTGGPYDYSQAHTAVRFTWPSQCPYSTGSCSPGDLLTFQAIMIQLDAPGDFMLQFNYNNFNDLPAGATANGLFQIGSSTGSYDGPFATVGPNYCFHGGALVDCSALVTATVPEPETTPLMVLGALAATAVAVGRRRRRITA